MTASETCRSEVDLRWRGSLLDRDLELHGRADLVYGDGAVEEIKTVLLEPGRFRDCGPDDFPAPVMQALIYAWMIEQRDRLEARLRVVNLASEPSTDDGAFREGDSDGEDDAAPGGERLFRVSCSRDELLQFLETQVAFCQSGEEARRFRHKRRRRLGSGLRFPYPEARPGQQELIRELELFLARERVTLLSAPTGLGKSVCVLYPALKRALLNDRRVFFCTAKNTGREAALKVLEAFHAQGAEIGCVAMASRESMCPAETYFCHEDHCPFLRGFRQRLEAALADLDERLIVGRRELEAAGIKHRLCPHELALSLCESRDLVIGDYNYVFDPLVRLRRLFVEGDPDELLLLVDEAHNLPSRGRGYFSAELRLSRIRDIVELVRQRGALGDLFHGGPLKGVYVGLIRALEMLQRLVEDYQSMLDDEFVFAREQGRCVLGVSIDLVRLDAARSAYETHLVDYLLQTVIHGTAVNRDPLVEFYRELERFGELAARDAPPMRHVAVVERGAAGEDLALAVNCAWAGDWIGEQLGRVHAAVLFSATLKPWEYHRSELGIDGQGDAGQLEAESPFPPEHRLLVIHEGFSTRFRHRLPGIGRLAAAVTGCFAAVGGNTAVFLPSFEYLRRLREALPGDLPLLVHDGSMEPSLRAALLKKLSRGGPRLLLSVMGGIFAEAVDYPGRMLECAVVVGPGLPQLSYERELARLYYEETGSAGFDRAYRLPGLCRVLQAAGRVIRRSEDRGSIVLLCDRFNEWENRRIIEEYFGEAPAIVSDRRGLVNLLQEFHGNHIEE